MIVKSVKQGRARTAARAQRLLETGDLFVLGYSGRTCDDAGNKCSPGVCNEGRCENIGNDGFRCICPAGYSGERCEEGLLLIKGPWVLYDLMSKHELWYNSNFFPVWIGCIKCHCLRKPGRGHGSRSTDSFHLSAVFSLHWDRMNSSILKLHQLLVSTSGYYYFGHWPLPTIYQCLKGKIICT